MTERYRPRALSEIEDPVSLINEPLAPDNVALLVPRSARGIHAVLVEALNSVQALINRLERGVSVPDRGREPIRELYVSARRQRDALLATLELDGME